MLINDFSLLQKCVGLVNVHISGLLRRLALCFYSQNFQGKFNDYSVIEMCVHLALLF